MYKSTHLPRCTNSGGRLLDSTRLTITVCTGNGDEAICTGQRDWRQDMRLIKGNHQGEVCGTHKVASGHCG
jgi:hypothetical protein